MTAESIARKRKYGIFDYWLDLCVFAEVHFCCHYENLTSAITNPKRWRIKLNKKHGVLATALVSACLSTSALADPVPVIPYAVDDGTAEASVGGVNEGSTFIWANQFNAPPGGDTITEIQVVFGDPITTSGGGEENGAGVTVSLWNDVNNDGSPDDAVLLATTVGAIASSDTDTLETFDIPDSAVTGSFFIGVAFTGPAPPPMPQNLFPAALDTTCDASRSWYVLGDDITDSPISTTGTAFEGNWLVRATSTNGVWINPCTNDLDGDTVVDALDNCPSTPNVHQADFDEDGIGNRCDDDFDPLGC